MKSDEQILAEIGKAAGGLLLMSESDYPLEPFRMEGPHEPPPERLRQLAGEAEDAPVETLSLDDFFRAAAATTPRQDGGAAFGSFHPLVRTLKENLTGLRVYKVGRINMPVYVVGRSSSGSWLGISTRVVQT
jgi:hypothetical protein